jgi:hypothetical protein
MNSSELLYTQRPPVKSVSNCSPNLIIFLAAIMTVDTIGSSIHRVIENLETYQISPPSNPQASELASRDLVRKCRRFTLNSPRISAKFVSVSRKCPKLSRKCPTFFRAFCQRFLCFHTHSYFQRHFLTSFFCSIPCRTFPKALIRHHIRRKQESSNLCRCADCQAAVSGDEA